MEIREIPIEKLNQLDHALQEVLDDLTNRVIPKQNSEKVNWDYIRAEIWEDSGRVIFFPASSKTNDRIDILANFVFCAELLEKVEEFDESDLPDEEYDVVFSSLIANIGQQVIGFFSNNNSFKVRCFDQDGHEIKT